jgi:dienelactone hydrolase
MSPPTAAKLGLAVLVVAAGTAGATSIDGHWVGTIDRGTAKLEVSFDFTGSAGRFTSVTQRAMDYPLDSVAVTGDAVHAVLGGSLVFDGTRTGDVLAGKYHDDDGDATFALHRTPAPKLPYDTVDVTFGDVKLTGTLAIPRTPGRHAAVVLVHGSGPETRWGTNRFIADQLARAGVVALIYDKRGSGTSGGDWKTADFDDLARDALAGVALLARRKDVDAHRIGVHGHSQGGIIAADAAKLAPDAIAFVVAEDTNAGPVWKQDLYRTERALGESFKPAEVQAAMKLYALFVDVALGKRPYAELAKASVPVAHERWFEWLAIPPEGGWIWPWYAKTGGVDTLALWREVRVPTLLIYGERDALMPVDASIEQIEGALAVHGARVAAWIAPRAEHNLTIHPAPGQPFFWWYGAPGVIDTVVAWIKMIAS